MSLSFLAQQALVLLDTMDIRPTVICDNNSELWGRSIILFCILLQVTCTQVLFLPYRHRPLSPLKFPLLHKIKLFFSFRYCIVHNFGRHVCRKDFQIKHQGHRIELGEIEIAASSISGVYQSCALYNTEKTGSFHAHTTHQFPLLLLICSLHL